MVAPKSDSDKRFVIIVSMFVVIIGISWAFTISSLW